MAGKPIERHSWTFKGTEHHTMPVEKIDGVWCYVNNGAPARLEPCGDCGKFGVCDECCADIERAARGEPNPNEKPPVNWWGETNVPMETPDSDD